MKKEKLSLRFRIQEWKYWHISRRTQKIVPWLARKLPKKLKYFVVIDGMVKVEPNLSPTNVTGMQMLDLFGDKYAADLS